MVSERSLPAVVREVEWDRQRAALFVDRPPSALEGKLRERSDDAGHEHEGGTDVFHEGKALAVNDVVDAI